MDLNKQGRLTVDYVHSIWSNHRTLPRFFSPFDTDKLGKIRRRHWKVRLNIGKLAKFESDCLSEQRHSFAKLRNFTDVCLVGGWGVVQVCAPAILLILRRIFQGCPRIFLNLSMMSKVEFNRRWVFWIERNCRREIS